MKHEINWQYLAESLTQLMAFAYQLGQLSVTHPERVTCWCLLYICVCKFARQLKRVRL